MTEPQGTDAPDSPAWIAALHEIEATGVFRDEPNDDEERLPSLWSRLSNARESPGGETVNEVRALLEQVASFMCRPDDWLQPYEPMFNMAEGRSAMPSDLSENQIEILGILAPAITDYIFRARICDVVAIRTTGADRVQWFRHKLAALSQLNLAQVTRRQDQDVLDRGLRIGARLGKALEIELEILENLVVDHALNAGLTENPGWGADCLQKHALGRSRAHELATRMQALATCFDLENLDQARAYHQRAADWFTRAGLSEQADESRLAFVQSFLSEAEHLNASERKPAARSGFLYERALKALRQIPRSRREALGVGALAGELAGRIRAAGATALGSMGVFQSESVDLGDLRRYSIAAVTNKSPLEALRAFTALVPSVSLEKDRKFAEEMISEHPLQSLFSTVHYSQDGRIIHRSAHSGGAKIYGEDPSVWRQLVQGYEFRMGLEVQGSLAPAWLALTNEHTLTVNDFLAIARGSSIVPADRERLYAQALLYGFNGDFATAAQLLTPQLEHLVRVQFRNAGQATTNIDAQGIENEIGLSALMNRETAAVILGEDIAYIIRAFFCGPIGPNLRNEVAHGLINDAWSGSAQSLHCWWFMLRLSFIPYWNRLHDSEMVEDQEPAERPQPDDVPE